MHEGKIDFLFNLLNTDRFYFQESWQVESHAPEEAINRLLKIATARLMLLAKNVCIVRLTLTGSSLQRHLWPGIGGEFASPWDNVLCRRDNWNTKRGLRGVPKEIFSRDGLTVKGISTLATFNRVLSECRCVALRNGQTEPFGNLQMTRSWSKKMGSCKKARKSDLIELLGREEGQKAWDELTRAKKGDKEKFRIAGQRA